MTVLSQAPARVERGSIGLFELTRAVSVAENAPQIYEAALRALQQTLGVERASVLLFDADGVMRFKAWRGLSTAYRAATAGHSPWVYGATEAEPLLVEDVANDASLEGLRGVLDTEGICALAFIPLLSAGRVVGKFMLYYARPHHFDANELLIAQTIAAHIAFALDQLRAQDERRASESLLAGQKHSLELLASGASLREVLASLVQIVDSSLEHQAVASVLLLDNDGRLHDGASPGLPRYYLDAIDGLRADARGPSFAAAAATGAVVITHDISTDMRWRPLRHIPLALGFCATWSQPIIGREGDVLGTFDTYFRERREPTARERQVADVLARTASIAIEHTHASAERLRQREHLDAVFRSTAAGIVEMDTRGTFLMVNDRFCAITGRSRQELLAGLDSATITVEDDRQETIDGFASLRLGAPHFTVEKRYWRPGASVVWVSNTISAIRDDSGELLGALAVVTDITERRDADDLIRESERRYRELVEALVLPVYTTDAEGYITLFNQAAVDLWGRVPTIGEDQWCGSWRIYSPDGEPIPHDACPMAISLIEQRPVRGQEIIAERPDGTRAAILPYPTPVRDASGTVVGAVNVLVDISDRKRAEAAARESEERFRFLANNAPAMIWMTGPAGGTIFLSKGFLTFAGTVRESDYARPWTQLIHPADAAAWAEREAAGYANAEPFEGEFRLRRHDGAYRWVFCQAAPILQAGTVPSGYVGTLQDVTDRRDAETRLLEAAAQKDEFLGLVSHELRTPISTILGNGLLLQRRLERLQPTERAQAIEDVVSEAEKLQEIIENLLLLTRLEGGQVELEPVVLAAAASPEIARLKKRQPGRPLTITIDEGLPLVLGQATFVRLILRNLLTNAEKYSPPGTPIEVSLLHNDGRVEVQVRDHGPGIPEADRERVFSPFYRAPTARAHGNGIGLGLTVCKRLSETQGGDISVRNAEDGGAMFLLSLATVSDLEDGE